MAPTEPDAKWQAWLVDQAPAPPFFLFISEGEFDGALQKICGVTNPYAPESEVVPYLLYVLGLEDPMHTDVSARQRMRLWQTEVNGESSIITVTDATPMGEVGISLSGMMKADE